MRRGPVDVHRARATRLGNRVGLEPRPRGDVGEEDPFVRAYVGGFQDRGIDAAGSFVLNGRFRDDRVGDFRFAELAVHAGADYSDGPCVRPSNPAALPASKFSAPAPLASGRATR